jgi:hypothetical protein
MADTQQKASQLRGDAAANAAATNGATPAAAQAAAQAAKAAATEQPPEQTAAAVAAAAGAAQNSRNNGASPPQAEAAARAAAAEAVASVKDGKTPTQAAANAATGTQSVSGRSSQAPSSTQSFSGRQSQNPSSSASGAAKFMKTYGSKSSSGAPVNKEFIQKIFDDGSLEAPVEKATSIEDLFARLNKLNSKAVNEFVEGTTVKEFIRLFNSNNLHEAKVRELKTLFTVNLRAEEEQPLPWSQPDISVNKENLHIALLYPGIASYLKKVRARVFSSAAAVRSPIYGGLPLGLPSFGAGITLQLRGGGELNANYPIEMRGVGSLMASSMRGGSAYPLAIGTVNSPTIWRPITDESFISDSLKLAVQKLKSKLKEKDMTLADDVNKKINERLVNLELAENEAKDYRDQLTKVAKQIKMSDHKSGSELDDGKVNRLVEEYNDAMKKVSKNESVLLRVLHEGNEVFTYSK